METERSKKASKDCHDKEAPENLSQAFLRIIWPSKLKFVWLFIIAVCAGLFAFFGHLPAELVMKPFLNEKIRVLKYDSQFSSSQELLHSGNPQEIIEGISLLQELSLSYPYRRQEIVNELQKFLMGFFPQDREIDERHRDVLEHAIRTITTIPRYDDNGHPINIDIHQARIQGIDLTNTNFKGVSLWGCVFDNVILSRSNFENADLGGTQFLDSSLEYVNFAGAKINASFMDLENGQPRPTRFIKTRLYGSNLEQAEIGYGELKSIPDLDDRKRKLLSEKTNLQIFN